MNRIRTLTQSRFISFVYRNLSQSELSSKSDGNADIKISQSCVDRLNKIASNGQYLRITVDGGGCSGFQYRFDLDSHIKEDDECFEKDGAKIVVDKMSLSFIKGSTVDYHQELIRAAFRIADNPLADTRCSCGSSFAIKMS